MDNGKLKIDNVRSKLIHVAFLLLTAYCLPLTAHAQNDGTEQNATGRTGTFAIIGARIVTVSGAVIENGTVIIQNGKIAAVGTRRIVERNSRPQTGHRRDRQGHHSGLDQYPYSCGDVAISGDF